MTDDISKFLNKYKDSKKSDFTEDGTQTLKDKFKVLWEYYSEHNPFNHQSKVYLISGNKFDSYESLWKFMCNRFPKINDAKLQVNEEFKDDINGNIPTHLLELLTFLQEIDNQNKEIYKKNEEIKKLINTNQGLNCDINNLKSEIQNLNEQIEQLKEAVEEQKKLKNVIAKDESQKTVENYQKIADELSYGYSVFEESKSMEMSSDLGEVLRDQLNEIYSILSKNGIKLGAQ